VGSEVGFRDGELGSRGTGAKIADYDSKPEIPPRSLLPNDPLFVQIIRQSGSLVSTILSRKINDIFRAGVIISDFGGIEILHNLNMVSFR
jgi:hypothetical protein